MGGETRVGRASREIEERAKEGPGRGLGHHQILQLGTLQRAVVHLKENRQWVFFFHLWISDLCAGFFLAWCPLEADICILHCERCVGVVNMAQVGWYCEQESVENCTANDTQVQSSHVVSQFVSKEANNRRSNKYTERKDGVHKSNINIIYPDIFHVYCEVGQYGERGPIEEKQSEFQGKEIHVRIKKFLGI